MTERDSRPNATPWSIFKRYYDTGFTTVVFKDEVTYMEMVLQFEHGNKDAAIFKDRSLLRYLNQKEMEICQTVPIGYTSSISRNEAAGLLGDGWTVDVIAHIFQYLK